MCTDGVLFERGLDALIPLTMAMEHWEVCSQGAEPTEQVEPTATSGSYFGDISFTDRINSPTEVSTQLIQLHDSNERITACRSLCLFVLFVFISGFESGVLARDFPNKPEADDLNLTTTTSITTIVHSLIVA